ncbi:MAG: helix-turn-helix domain-containing protein [Massiliimalia sp.]|jgi:transcriptional regulator with XRE-family HTH domain
MKKTLGEKIYELRKANQLTQEELAEKTNVSPQAVSKWEKDLSIPDLPVLIDLADLFEVSLDYLVREKEETVRFVPQEQRKNLEEMFLRIHVHSADGDRIKVNLPLALIKMVSEIQSVLPQINGSDILQKLDFQLIISLIESGAMGKLIEIDGADGDRVEVTVE